MSLSHFVIPGLIVFMALLFGKPLLGFLYGIYYNISEFLGRKNKREEQ